MTEGHLEIPIPEKCRDRARALLDTGAVRPDDIIEFRRGSTIIRGTAEKFATRVFSAVQVEPIPRVRVNGQ